MLDAGHARISNAAQSQLTEVRGREMIDAEILKSIASQLMTKSSVHVEGNFAPVRRTSAQRLKTAAFSLEGQEYQAIEQNPDKSSRWGQLARSGHQVVQFKERRAEQIRGSCR